MGHSGLSRMCITVVQSNIITQAKVEGGRESARERLRALPLPACAASKIRDGNGCVHICTMHVAPSYLLTNHAPRKPTRFQASRHDAPHRPLHVPHII